ncbi:MAG: indole-3-glycerol phosphate synthase TrpC, partial [Deltaproteobacteria bacterium]|nr:indole-3-glycerol phosphate synthase TrpC [Deltaproteobacteria bacterium]
MILDEIVATKGQEVKRAKEKTPLAAWERLCAQLPPTRDFAAALAAPETAIIAEVKRRSPSRGILREGLDPAALARIYEAHGAAAVSVLTDSPYFGGSNADLTAVKEAVSLPVLRKEFIIDPWQIYEARAIGADAILLIAALLTAAELRRYLATATALGLAALVEVHDGGELRKALASGAAIVGINNRDLQTFRTDIEISHDLAARIPV